MQIASLPDFWIYPSLLGAFWGIFIGIKKRTENRNLAALQDAKESGLTEPASLHPVINPNRCLGCGSCVGACPEQNSHKVLGIIKGKSTLIGPTHCIGHGACAKSCPQDAITLVFGTATRGVDLPHVNSNFESNIEGLFIAGELGGMGLIRNAISQGTEAVAAISKVAGIGKGKQLDLVIVGAGPAGFAASLSAKAHKLRYQTIEQDTLGGTISKYPRGKIVMTSPAKLPIIGKMKFRETTKEKLIDFLQNAEQKSGLQINYQEQVEKIEKTEQGFKIKTSRTTYQARNVLLSLGRRGTPRRLEVPGEDLSKVVYQLIDPEQYKGNKVLVVGGGDSAIEAAFSLAEVAGTSVTLSYRGEAFSRARQKNRDRLRQVSRSGRVRVLLESQVREIKPTTVKLEHAGNQIEIANDAVIVCAGGVLPTGLLKDTGVLVEKKFGTP